MEKKNSIGLIIFLLLALTFIPFVSADTTFYEESFFILGEEVVRASMLTGFMVLTVSLGYGIIGIFSLLTLFIFTRETDTKNFIKIVIAGTLIMLIISGIVISMIIP